MNAFFNQEVTDDVYHSILSSIRNQKGVNTDGNYLATVILLSAVSSTKLVGNW